MDYDAYAVLERQYPRGISNDFLMPPELRRMFACDAVEVLADDDALFLFERREGFIKLHFRIKNMSVCVPRREGTVASYLTYRGDRPPDAAGEWLLGQGFEKRKTLRRYTAQEIAGGQDAPRS